MPFRRLAAALSIALLFVAATPKKKKVAPAPPAPHVVAPDSLPHSQAMFLTALSQEGKERVTFKAAAYGKHFFLEEPSGVTVYSYAGGDYRKEAFLKGATLEGAMKKYPDQMK